MTKQGDYHQDRADGRLGRRVELPTFSDQWMQGARFGTVRQVLKAPGREDILAVRCDHPQVRRLYRHHADNFRFLES